ncbi:MAG: glycosyltransferase family 87 protein [Saprospiraceae bacterium]
MNRITQWISDRRILLLLFILLSSGASIQSFLLPPVKYENNIKAYNKFNNYVIFRQSFYHLTDGKDIYQPFPQEHWDLYKYSPAFSLLFGIFATLPDYIGLIIWNCLNAILFVLAIYYLPKIPNFKKGLILLACLLEMMTSIQNEQSNGLMAGLLILAFGLCERKHFFIAAMCIVLSAYIKLFGIVGMSLFLFYPQKWKLTLYSFFWAIIFFLIPLLVIDFGHLLDLYHSWFQLLSSDHSPSAYGFSVFGWLKTWFHFQPQNIWILITGAFIFLIPFTRIKMYSAFDFRLLALCSLLIWVVIFNHMAESPTFIIAMGGIAIWFFTRKMTLVNVILFSLAILLTSLSSTDIISHDFRNQFVRPYVLKAFPCILIWIKIIMDMMRAKMDIEWSTSDQPLSVNTGRYDL